MDVEQRSIEFIPHNERYGTPKRLFTIWFSANMQVTALVVGTLGIVSGLSLLWTIVALVIGNVIGTIFMAAHSAQGPHLGIPQMIQSRAQFGVFGAALPLVIVTLAYVLFVAADGVVMRESIKAIYPMPDNQAIILFGAVTFVISYIGYELIHKLGASMTVLSFVVFSATAVLIVGSPHLPMPSYNVVHHGFSGGAFNLIVAQAASWTLGFGPYVADYSRYLPDSVRTRDTFWYTYLGGLLGSLSVMVLGAVLATVTASVVNDPGTAIAALFGAWSKPVLMVVVCGVLVFNVLSLYSSYMSAVTIFSGFRKVSRIHKSTKFVVLLLLCALATWIAIATQYHFSDYFADILNAQIYVLVPWSSINLVDYYLVRRGSYSVTDMYDVDGQYGAFNLQTIMIYCVGIASTIPFMDLSFYHSYFARMIGADVSWIPSLIVPGMLYYFFANAQQQRSPLWQIE
ncbi:MULTISPECIES: purine-cytosine permease family protein [Burkholderia cepacia complex]|uniref:purine-cytosine permease family protein n=1 Tax=Burkholderia cepacia complex TaxID=87882 RepID=UPI0026DF0A01|nr:MULTISPECIES: cytosine permease [Burkholderia cepacia complex]MDO5947599.1 cytosine permease [Burkholderia cepacia]MDS0807064.1 cytosine permease [Burkholderia cenocepacia]